MSVRERIEDSKLLFAAGRLEGALLSVLIAVAGTSRKRYPQGTKSKRHLGKEMGDREAFEEFLLDEIKPLTAGVCLSIEFEGSVYTLEQLLYKFMRNSLVHEAQLHEHISVDYGDFLLDKRGTCDFITFSSEVVVRLAYVVETAKENAGCFSTESLDSLPEPIDLKTSAIVHFKWGDGDFEFLCHACSCVSEIWEGNGQVIDWLHVKAVQRINGVILGDRTQRHLIPIRYVTSITKGPAFTVSRRRSSPDVGVFPPNQSEPQGILGEAEVRSIVQELQIEMVKSSVTLQRPLYEAPSAP
jgi:hypothetical protein